MLVEVFGPSCAGKTTLISGVQQTLVRDGIRAQVYHGEGRERFWIRSMDVARGIGHPRFMLWFVLNLPQTLTREVLKFMRAAGLARRLRMGDTITILDNGPLKRTSILAKGSRYPKLLIRGGPKPDLAVLVECDFDIRLGRIRATGRPWALGTTDQELRARDLVKTEVNSRIIRELEIEVLRFDTSLDEDFSDVVAERIRDRVRSRH